VEIGCGVFTAWPYAETSASIPEARSDQLRAAHVRPPAFAAAWALPLDSIVLVAIIAACILTT
jgi:hypothetical protein